MTQPVPDTYLDKFFESGYNLVESGSSSFPPHTTIDIEGPGVSVSDDPVNDRTKVTITGGGIGTVTTLTAGFVQPAVSANVTAQVNSTADLAPGLVVFVANGGYYTVASVIDGTHASITNLGVTGNASPGASIPSASLVIGSGPANQVFVQGNDVGVTPRSILDFRGFTVADDSANGRTVVTNTTGAPVTVSGSHTLAANETWLLVHPGDVVTMNATPVVGQPLKFTPVGRGFATNPIIWNGNGHNLIDPQDFSLAAAASVTGRTDDTNWTFAYDGTVFRCVNT